MNSEQQKLLQAIRADPDNDGARLLYADWLEGRGDPQGALIRVQCQIACLAPSDSSRAELESREVKLLRQCEPLCGGVFRSGTTVDVFSRGFVETLTLWVEDLSREEFASVESPWNWATLAPRTCLRSLKILSRVRREDFRGFDAKTDLAWLEALMQSPALISLTALEIRHPIGPAGVEILVRSPHLGRLTHLCLAGWDGTTKATDPDWSLVIGSEGVLCLARSPFASRLLELDISLNELNHEAVQSLVDSAYLRTLRKLRIQPDGPWPVYGRVSESLPPEDRRLLRSRFGEVFHG